MENNLFQLYLIRAHDRINNLTQCKRPIKMKINPIIGLLNKIQIPNCSNKEDYIEFNKYFAMNGPVSQQFNKIDSILKKIKDELKNDEDSLEHIFKIKNNIFFKENNFYYDINNTITQIDDKICKNVKFILSSILLDEKIVNRSILLKYIYDSLETLFIFDESKLIDVTNEESGYINSKIIKEWKRQNKCIISFLKLTHQFEPNIMTKLNKLINTIKNILLTSKEKSLKIDFFMYVYVDFYTQFNIKIDPRIINIIKSNLKYSTIFFNIL